MKYYASYKPETGKTHIIAYDEAKRGAPRIVNDHTTFLYHNSIIVSRVYNTVADALLGSLGKYSNRPSFCRMAARRRRTGSLELPAPRTCSSRGPM